jgi:hypothetical protein
MCTDSGPTGRSRPPIAPTLGRWARARLEARRRRSWQIRWRSFLLGSGSAGSEQRIGATADQDRHRPGHQDQVDDWRVVEQSTMQPLRGGRRAVNARVPDGAARTAMLHNGCAHLIDKPWLTKPGDAGGERVGRIIFGPMIIGGRANNGLPCPRPNPSRALTGLGASSNS